MTERKQSKLIHQAAYESKRNAFFRASKSIRESLGFINGLWENMSLEEQRVLMKEKEMDFDFNDEYIDFSEN